MTDNNSIENAKRQAMTGQWRTPPLPAFAAQQNHQQQQRQQQQQQQHGMQQPQPTNTNVPIALPPIPASHLQEIPLPESTDDYAKALQEAYRRGAEAAARLNQSQQMSASCPNLQQFQGLQVPNDPTLVNALVPNPLTGSAPINTQHHVAQPPPQQQVSVVQHQLHHQQHQQQQQQQQQQQYQPHHQPTQVSHHPVPQSTGSRSLSLPDMQSYAARAQAEEEKRKKRLARNRASARLRRLRKKNLVRTRI